MADNPILKDIIQTRDDDGNEVDIYPKTSEDQVIGLDKYAKSLSAGDGELTVTNGDGTFYQIPVKTMEDRPITDEEIIELWGIEDSNNIYY